MTPKEFAHLASEPHSVEAIHQQELYKWTSRYPFFSQARILLLKAGIAAGPDSLGDEELETASLYVNDLRWLFFYLYPEMELAPGKTEYKRPERFSGSYFDILNAATAEGDDAGLSLRKIAQRLKESRSMLQKVETGEIQQPEIDQKEEQVRLLIHEARYADAIEILKQLNLIYPKKSIYFADQIRFLEKIIENLK